MKVKLQDVVRELNRRNVRFSDVDNEIRTYKQKLNKLASDTRKAFTKLFVDYQNKWSAIDDTVSSEAIKQMDNLFKRLDTEDRDALKGIRLIESALYNIIVNTK